MTATKWFIGSLIFVTILAILASMTSFDIFVDEWVSRMRNSVRRFILIWITGRPVGLRMWRRISLTFLAASFGVCVFSLCYAHSHISHDESHRLIVRGRAVDVLSTGNGPSRVCVQRPNRENYCGIADPSLHVKKGDEVYICPALFLSPKNSNQVRHYPDAVLITRTDALELASTGDFRIVNE